MPALELINTTLYSDANLISYYRLEADGTDSKGSNTLTVHGSPSFAAAKFNNGVDLGTSNTTKYLDIASNLGITGGAITLMCWIKINAEPPNGGNNYTFMQQSSSTNHVFYQLAYYQASGVLRLYFDRLKNPTDQALDVAITALGTTNWHFIVATNDGVNSNSYVDGSLVGGPTAASGNGSSGLSNTFNIGDENSGGVQQFFSNAMIDDAAVFSRALSATEISNHYNGLDGIIKTTGAFPTHFRGVHT